MPPITPELSAEIGKRLRETRDDVLAAVRERTDSDAPEIAPNTHTFENEDRPQAEMISHNEEHLADHETALLHEIDVALGKLESGGYGICVECGREIPEARLLATPTVQTCIECQQQIEREQERRNGPPPTI
ncbi:TraR/DksA family transcriptional regulator [Massilia horti]|uniref:TraR/DksA family transcriptional regulator n=1 Tax=Massilia horti TaxID=2562153 RepID=A0A4Y9SPH4_9BURK|nr:TraR/DksA family transcriptional regulator [Massilia horti]TFW28451.1 TraR/DksA family transcriptional regulator [Massilia horti]